MSVTGDEDGDGLVDDVGFYDGDDSGSTSSTSTSSSTSSSDDSDTDYTLDTGGSGAYYEDVTADTYSGEDDLEEASDQSDPYDYEDDTSNWTTTDDSDSGSYGVRDYASDVTAGEEGDETTGAVNADLIDEDDAGVDPNAEVQRYQDTLMRGVQVDGDLLEGFDAPEVVGRLGDVQAEVPVDVQALLEYIQSLRSELGERLPSGVSPTAAVAVVGVTLVALVGAIVTGGR